MRFGFFSTHELAGLGADAVLPILGVVFAAQESGLSRTGGGPAPSQPASR